MISACKSTSQAVTTSKAELVETIVINGLQQGIIVTKALQKP